MNKQNKQYALSRLQEVEEELNICKQAILKENASLAESKLVYAKLILEDLSQRMRQK